MRVFFIMNAHGFERFQPFRISLYTETYSRVRENGITNIIMMVVFQKTNICSLKCVHLYFLKESMRQYEEESFFYKKIKFIYLWMKRENYRTTREGIAIFRKSLLCVWKENECRPKLNPVCGLNWGIHSRLTQL